MEPVYQDEVVVNQEALTPLNQVKLKWNQQPGFLPLLRQKNLIDQHAALLPYAGPATLPGWLSPGMFALQGLVLIAAFASLLNWQMTRHAGKLEHEIAAVATSVQTETQRQEGIIAATEAEIRRISSSGKSTFNLHISSTPLTREQALAALNSALNESRASEQQYKDRMAQRETQLRAKQSTLALANSGTPLMFALALVLAAGLVGKNVPREFARSRLAQRMGDFYLYFATAEGLWPNLVFIVFLHIALSGNVYGLNSVFDGVGPLFWVIFWIGFYFLVLRYMVTVARSIYQAAEVRLPGVEWGLENKMLLCIHNSVLITFVGLESAFLVLCCALYFASK